MAKCYELPEGAAVLVEAIGISAALSVVHVYAGTRLYIPRAENLDEVHPLARLLGHPLARRLADAMGGDYFSVPMAQVLLEEERDRKIEARIEGGESAADIAQSYGLTERQIYERARRYREKTKSDAHQETIREQAPKGLPTRNGPWKP